MRKLIVFLLIFALFAGSVFGQEAKTGWKVGFGVRAKADLLYTTAASGSLTTDDTYTFGKRIAGSFNVMDGNFAWAPGNEIWLSFSHTGENHDIYVEVANINDINELSLNGFLMDKFLNSNDWWVKGNAGIFDGYLGSIDYGGFVPVYDTFNYYIGTDDYLDYDVNRFGVYRPGFVWRDSAVIGTFGTKTFALGISPIDGFRFALGTSIDMLKGTNEPFGNYSGINGAFMFSGRNIADMVSFDVFYGIRGKDDDTRYRPDLDPNPANNPFGEVAFWENVLGLYAGVSLLNDTLGISLGYTANFDAYEKWAYYPGNPANPDPKESEPGSISAPIYSGVSLHVNFTGVDGLNVALNNSISFAGAAGDLAPADIQDKYKFGLYGTPIYKDVSQSWFVLHTSLSAKYQLSDPLTVTLQLANVLGIDKQESTTTNTTTTDELRIALTAEYSLGSVTFGTGLSFGVIGKTNEYQAANGNTTIKKADIFQFGIPLVFQVAF